MIDHYNEQSPSNAMHQCQCPSQVVSMKDSSVIFSGLNLAEGAKFPLVSRKDHQAFYGLPPVAITPKPQALKRPVQRPSTPTNSKKAYSLPITSQAKRFPPESSLNCVSQHADAQFHD